MKRDDGSVSGESAALLENEVGTYKLNPDGTKGYLLFRCYRICLEGPDDPELCAGYERCYQSDCAALLLPNAGNLRAGNSNRPFP